MNDAHARLIELQQRQAIIKDIAMIDFERFAADYERNKVRAKDRERKARQRKQAKRQA